MKNNFILNVVAFILIFMATALFAYTDSDMDGVDDAIDKCPNTPLSDLVNVQGCTVKKLERNFNFDIVYGINYADSNQQHVNNLDIPAASLRLDYYYKNFSIQASTSYYLAIDQDNNTTTGLYDTYLGVAYQFQPRSDVLLNVGLAAILPTYSSESMKNKTDYKAYGTLTYMKKGATVFGGYSYTIINDEVVGNTGFNYEDSAAYHVGAGYSFTNRLYMSAAYNNSDSIYTKVENLETASVYGYYSINERRFFIFSYAYGLSKTANPNSFTALMGYYF
jgi:predicted porin